MQRKCSSLSLLDPFLPFVLPQLIGERGTPTKGGMSDVASVQGAPQKVRQSLGEAGEEVRGEPCIMTASGETGPSWEPSLACGVG